MIDETDREILAIIQANARTSNAEIARQLGMAPSAIFERIKKLESRDIIRGYEARLSPKALGHGLLAFVFVRSDESAASVETGQLLAEIPEVQEVHHVAGEDCYLVKVRVADPEDMGRLLREGFGRIPSIRSTRTTIVLDSVKESAMLALPEAPKKGEGQDAA